MCIPGIIFEYEEEMSMMKSPKKEKKVEPKICAYSGLPSLLHYDSKR